MYICMLQLKLSISLNRGNFQIFTFSSRNTIRSGNKGPQFVI